MDVQKTQSGDTVTLCPEGRLDIVAAPEMDKALVEALSTADKVELDFANLDYVSSAGLRVLLQMQKKTLDAGKQMAIKNVSPEIMKIFELTGFTTALTIN